MKFSEVFYEGVVTIPKVNLNDAYWISPRGEIMPVDMRHILEIQADPEKFGLSKEYIDDIKERYGDKALYGEGDAREEVMLKLMANGWVRIRKFNSRQGSFWTIQLDTGNSRSIPRLQRKNIIDWGLSMIQSDEKRKNDDVRVLNQKGEMLFGGTYISRNAKNIEQMVLDDTGVFYESKNIKSTK
jgi:hypothetical protein